MECLGAFEEDVAEVVKDEHKRSDPHIREKIGENDERNGHKVMNQHNGSVLMLESRIWNPFVWFVRSVF